MKMKLLILIVSMVFLSTFMLTFVNAEIFLWNEVDTDTTENTTSHRAFYKLEDTSAGGKSRSRVVPVEFHYFTESLPFNLTGGQVDWCNFTITSYHNEYDSEGNYLNATLDVQSFYFTTGVNDGIVIVELIDSDNIIADMKCHYTDGDYLFDEDILVGEFNTNVPSYQCSGCNKYTLEELSNENERFEEITENELSIYRIIKSLIDMNYQLWLIVSWIVKLFFLIFAVSLVFAMVYHIYKFLEDIARRI